MIEGKVDNGATAEIEINGRSYTAGVKASGSRVELAYYGPTPGRLPLAMTIDGKPATALERVSGGSRGFTVLVARID